MADSNPLPLPHRPRLADHAMLRRHLVDGAEHIMVHDPERAEILEIDNQQLLQILACDGTRDIGGVVLAAVKKGAYRRLSELNALLAGLHERGLLVDGIAAELPAPEAHPERRLEVLPGYSLHCDQNGGCCSTYSSVPFSDDEASRALAAVPDVLSEFAGRQQRERVFLPLAGTLGSGINAVTMINGRCAFLGEGSSCRVHDRLGADAKPRGCRIFPASFVDDGSAIRVSVGVECACVLSSVGKPGGASLVPEGAACEAHLLVGSAVVRLPEQLPVSHDRQGTPAELRVWADAALAALGPDPDALAVLWSLADGLIEHGLDAEQAAAAARSPRPPAPAALALRLMALAGATADKRETSESWRAPSDRSRRLSEWLDVAAQALLDQGEVSRLLSDRPHPQQELFFLRATLFGHHLISPQITLAQALRDRATRLLLARKAAECVPPSCADDASVGYPLTAVEAMMRGQGLDGYARGLP